MRTITTLLGIFALILTAGLKGEDVDPRFAGVRDPIPEQLATEPGSPSPATLSTEAPVATAISQPAVVPEAKERSRRGLPFPMEAVVEPTPEGTIELRYGERADPPATENPFDYRLGTKAGESVPLLVSSVTLGLRPLAIVNGKMLLLGQRVSGFNLVHVDRDAVFMEKNGRILRLPVGQGVKVTEGGSK